MEREMKIKIKKIKFIYPILSVLLLIIVSGCEKQDKYADWKRMNNEWYTAYKSVPISYPFSWSINILNTDLVHGSFSTTSTGIKYKALRLGNPADRMPNPTSEIWATYEGKLIDGTTFDSGTDVDLGYITALVPGMSEILLKMHKGDIFEMYLPSDQGYGTNGLGGIPPYSVLIFRIELIDAIN